MQIYRTSFSLTVIKIFGRCATPQKTDVLKILSGIWCNLFSAFYNAKLMCSIQTCTNSLFWSLTFTKQQEQPIHIKWESLLCNLHNFILCKRLFFNKERTAVMYVCTEMSSTPHDLCKLHSSAKFHVMFREREKDERTIKSGRGHKRCLYVCMQPM